MDNMKIVSDYLKMSRQLEEVNETIKTIRKSMKAIEKEIQEKCGNDEKTIDNATKGKVKLIKKVAKKSLSKKKLMDMILKKFGKNGDTDEIIDKMTNGDGLIEKYNFEVNEK